MDTDTVIVAIGRTPNLIIQSTTEGLAVTKLGTIVVDENGKTRIEGVYAGFRCLFEWLPLVARIMLCSDL